MPGSRVVAARARLSERLNQQRAALAAAARCQDGVDVARARADELTAQGAWLVSEAEHALAAAVRQLAAVMGSVELAAALLDVDEAVVRKAIAIRRRIRDAGSARPSVAAPTRSIDAQAP
jgi:uncharacterized protein HemX